MIVSGDSKSTEFILQALIEHECQFVVKHASDNALRVAFHKGTWKLMLDNGAGFEITDGLEIVDCKDSLLRGFIEEKISQLKGKHDNWFRTVPATVILASLKVWYGFKEITEINVTQSGRDGWFTNFND